MSVRREPGVGPGAAWVLGSHSIAFGMGEASGIPGVTEVGEWLSRGMTGHEKVWHREVWYGD